MINIKKPLEAVRKSDGYVVPVTFNSLDSFHKDQFRTNECPDPTTTNMNWYLNGEDRCHSKLWTIRNVNTNTHVIRVRYAIPDGTPSYLSLEEASKIFLKYCSLDSIQAKIFRHEQQDINGLWTTTKVDVLDVIQPAIIKLFDMGMNPMGAARPLKTDSHVRVHMTGGIVVRLEIVHPS